LKRTERIIRRSYLLLIVLGIRDICIFDVYMYNDTIPGE